MKACQNGSECKDASGNEGLVGITKLSEMIGKDPVDSLNHACNCQNMQKYGPYCDWNEPDEKERDFCGPGKYNIENFLSGCECRDSLTNEAVPYHGWYCEVHNKLLCDNSKFYKGTFYDVRAMDKSKVADCCAPCKSCSTVIPNCDQCKQDIDTNCKSLIKKQNLYVYSGAIECLECKNEYNDLSNNCRNECDIQNNDGCNNETEICKNGILEEDGTKFGYTFCECQIPPLQLAEDGSCNYKPSSCNDGTTRDCYGNGKCVNLPGNTEKSCFCKITHAGKFCESPKTCENSEDFDHQLSCLNNGTCTKVEDHVDDVNDLYRCKCKAGFYGKYCEHIHPCHSFKVKVIGTYSMLKYVSHFSHRFFIRLMTFLRITVNQIKSAGNLMMETLNVITLQTKFISHQN